MRTIRKKSIFVSILIIVTISVFWVMHHDFTYKHVSITLGQKTFDTLVSDTESLREKGLGDREYLSPDQAMLFVFDRPDFYGFWMKDMHFPINMIWVDASSTIVGIEEDVRPETYPKNFFPKSPASFVIETNTGVSHIEGLHLGDHVSLPAFLP